MHRHLVARSHALVSLLATSACVLPTPLGGNDTGTGTGTDGGTTDGPGATSDPTAGDETGIDTGPAPAGPAAIDILFVMDNSGSMGEDREAVRIFAMCRAGRDASSSRAEFLRRWPSSPHAPKVREACPPEGR